MLGPSCVAGGSTWCGCSGERFRRSPKNAVAHSWAPEHPSQRSAAPCAEKKPSSVPVLLREPLAAEGPPVASRPQPGTSPRARTTAGAVAAGETRCPRANACRLPHLPSLKCEMPAAGAGGGGRPGRGGGRQGRPVLCAPVWASLRWRGPCLSAPQGATCGGRCGPPHRFLHLLANL